MNLTLKYGILLGALVVAWTFIMGIAGWHTHPTLQALFWVVILIQIVVVVLGLKARAADATYGSQVKAGTMMSLIAGVVIFIGSYIFTSVVFPNYFEELRMAGEEWFRSQGKPEAEIKALLDAQAPMQTSFMQALFGFIGTFLTGLIISLIAGAFLKSKTTAEPRAQA
jgi:hypothetical protein